MTGLRSADTTNRLAHLTGNSTILSILSRPYRESLNENLFSWMMRFNGSRHRLICFSASRWVLHLKPAALTVRKRQPPQAHLFLRFPVGLAPETSRTDRQTTAAATGSSVSPLPGGSYT